MFIIPVKDTDGLLHDGKFKLKKKPKSDSSEKSVLEIQSTKDFPDNSGSSLAATQLLLNGVPL